MCLATILTIVPVCQNTSPDTSPLHYTFVRNLQFCNRLKKQLKKLFLCLVGSLIGGDSVQSWVSVPDWWRLSAVMGVYLPQRPWSKFLPQLGYISLPSPLCPPSKAYSSPSPSALDTPFSGRIRYGLPWWGVRGYSPGNFLKDHFAADEF